MDEFLLLVIIAIGLWPCPCSTTKRKIGTTSTVISQKQSALEWTHYRNYTLNQEAYLMWPELDREKAKEICECYLQKIFPFKDVTMSQHIITEIKLFYRDIKNVNHKEVSVEVAALQCKLSKRDSRRTLFFFSRTLTPLCMHLLNSHVRGSKTKFHIVVEICNNYTHDDMKKNGDLTLEVLHTVNMLIEYDPVVKRKKWEETHFKYFLGMPEFYIKWTELNNEDARWKYCQIFVKRLHPRKQLEVQKTSYDSLIFRYIRIKTDNLVIVAALICQTPINSFNFVRAPNPECVYMVKKSPKWVNVLPASVSIVKRVCDKKAVQNETKQLPPPQREENEIVNEPTNEKGEW